MTHGPTTVTIPHTCGLYWRLFIQLHSSGFQFYPTLLLQPSDVPKPPTSLSITFKPNCSLLFTPTSSIIRRLVWNPVDQYGPQIQGLQRRNYGETVNPPVNSYITDDPSALVPGFDLRRREWCLLNCFRCDIGRCAASLHQWGCSDNPMSICGDIQSMSHSQQVWRWSHNSTHRFRFHHKVAALSSPHTLKKDTQCMNSLGRRPLVFRRYAHNEPHQQSWSHCASVTPDHNTTTVSLQTNSTSPDTI